MKFVDGDDAGLARRSGGDTRPANNRTCSRQTKRITANVLCYCIPLQIRTTIKKIRGACGVPQPLIRMHCTYCTTEGGRVPLVVRRVVQNYPTGRKNAAQPHD